MTRPTSPTMSRASKVLSRSRWQSHWQRAHESAKDRKRERPASALSCRADQNIRATHDSHAGRPYRTAAHSSSRSASSCSREKPEVKAACCIWAIKDSSSSQAASQSVGENSSIPNYSTIVLAASSGDVSRVKYMASCNCAATTIGASLSTAGSESLYGRIRPAHDAC
jgi:hypothetical protein